VHIQQSLKVEGSYPHEWLMTMVGGKTAKVVAASIEEMERALKHSGSG
jgi:hypothetical protein